MKLYEQYLQESITQRVINRVNTEVVNKELKLKTECYQRWIVHRTPKERVNYQLCLMRAQLQSIRSGISSAREGVKLCVDKGCKEEIRLYIEKLINIVRHQSKNYIRKKVVLLA
jgi:hypothetical protein